jgi:hypothetical protein
LLGSYTYYIIKICKRKQTKNRLEAGVFLGEVGHRLLAKGDESDDDSEEYSGYNYIIMDKELLHFLI